MLRALLFLILACTAMSAKSQDDWAKIDLSNAVSNDTITRGDFSLIFINKEESFNPVTREKMIETFFSVYPRQARIYNPKTTKQVVFVIDPLYEGIAAASSGIIKFNPGWFVKNPDDIDVVTHESMHLVQGYKTFEPGWVTEGIADYIRAEMGINNEAAGWKLPELRPEHNYTNAYRVTARFFTWIEHNKAPGLVRQLDEAMRKGKYRDNFWKKKTGYTVGELWDQYRLNPAISSVITH